MKSASRHLTPVTLELGGKSPCIVEKSANLKLAARRIVFGKFLNCGQTCVAPDYIYCDASIQDALVAELKKQISLQFTDHPLSNKAYGKIINEKHFSRISGLIQPEKVVHGGNSAKDLLKIEPTLMNSVTFEDPVMQEEIFGPVLPVLTYDSLGQRYCENKFQWRILLPCISLLRTDKLQKSNFSVQLWRRMHQRYHYSSGYQ